MFLAECLMAMLLQVRQPLWDLLLVLLRVPTVPPNLIPSLPPALSIP